MIDTAFQKYSTYKDSGAEWIGEIPEHWEMRKGKWLSKFPRKVIGFGGEYQMRG